MDLIGDWMPRRQVVGLVALAIVVCTWLMVAWWQRRALCNEARERALPACTSRLGSEEACREHLARYHDDCATLTFHGGKGRTSPGQKPYVNQQAYLECVVLGVDAWVAENGRQPR